MDTTTPVVLTAAAIDALPAEALDASIPGVTRRVLWRDGTSEAGVLVIAAGCHLGAHAHRRNHHHMWVVDGEVDILGTVVGPGGYVHVPAGAEHDLDARATGGANVFYLYEVPAT